MTETYAVGSAPWEVGGNSGSFPVGQAPWETSNTPSPTTPNASPNTQGGQQGYNPITDVFGSDTRKAGGFFSSLIQNTIGSKGLAGVGQLPGKVASSLTEYGPGGQHQVESLYNQATSLSDQSSHFIQLSKTEADPVKKEKYKTLALSLHQQSLDTQASADEIAQRVNTTPGQALGTSLNAALAVATGPEALGGKASLLGEVNPIFKPLARGASFINKTDKLINYGGRVAENAALGVGFNTANNLNEGNSIAQGDTGAALFGGLIPQLASGLSKGISLARSGSEKAGYELIGGLIKPLDKTFAYGKDPIRGIINEGITANSFDELGTKVSSKLQAIGSEIGSTGKAITNSGVTLDLAPTLAPIDLALEKAAKANQEPLFASLQRMKTSLMNDLGVGMDSKSGLPSIVVKGVRQLSGLDYEGAVNFLSDVRDHTRFTGNPSDDKILNATSKAIYGQVRELMNEAADKVSSEVGTRIRNLNERYADLSSTKLAIDHRELALKRQGFMSFVDKFGFQASAGIAIATGLATGNWTKAGEVLLGELGGIMASKIGRSTAVQTRVAKFLTSLGPTEREGILRSTPLLRNYWERLTGKGSSVPPQDINPNKLPVIQQSGLNKIPIRDTTPFLAPPTENPNIMDMGTYKLGKNPSTKQVELNGQFRKPGVNFYPPKKK